MFESFCFRKCECDEAGVSWRSVKPLPPGIISSNLITHTKMESARLFMDAVLKTDCSLKADREFESPSLRNIIPER